MSIQAICHHDDGWEHPSDGTLPCYRKRRFARLRRLLRSIDDAFGLMVLGGGEK